MSNSLRPGVSSGQGGGYPPQVVVMPGNLASGASAPPAPDLGGEEIDIGALGRILYRRRRLAILVFAATVIAGGANYLWERTFRPLYSGGFRMMISDPVTRDSPNSATQIEGLARAGLSVRVPDLIEALRSPAAVAPAAKRLGLPADAIAANLQLSQVETTTGIINVTLNWGEPRQGERILREISKDYLQYSLRERQQRLTQGLAFLDRQAPALQRQVSNLQRQLADFRIRNNFIDPSERAQILANKSQGVSDYLAALRLRALQLDAQAASVRAGQLGSLSTPSGSAAANTPGAPMRPNPGAMADSEADGTLGSTNMAARSYVQGPGGTLPARELGSTNQGDLVNTLTGIERDLRLAEVAYTDKSPMVQELREKQRALKTYIQKQALDSINSSRLNNRIDLELNERRLAELQRQFKRDPDLIRKYESLQQRLTVARDGLGSYIRARESFRLEVAQRTVPWQILNQPGFGYTPVQPNLQRSLFLSAVAGAVFGVMAALVRDRFDHVFHNPREVQAQLNLPLLGSVPHLPIESDRSLSETINLMDPVDRFALRESLRNLSTSFRMLRADRTVRLMTVTSTTQREGKSTIVALFGLTLSELGQKVLLVDSDMRRPTLHRRLGIVNERGLSNAFTEQDTHISTLIQPITERLDLVTAGPEVPDATKLLSSDRCATLVEEIRQLEGYDIVLFDSPPALQLADALLLSVHLDGLLFMVGIQRVDRSLPEQAIERIRETGVDLLGVVSNQVAQPVGSMGYGYSYGGSYGYSYGHYAYGHYVPQVSDDSKSDSTPTKRRPSGLWVAPKRLARRGTRRLVNWLDGRR